MEKPDAETSGEAKEDVDAQVEVARIIDEFRDVYEEFHADHLHADIEEDIAELFETLGPETIPHLINVREDSEHWAGRCAIRRLTRIGEERNRRRGSTSTTGSTDRNTILGLIATNTEPYIDDRHQ